MPLPTTAIEVQMLMSSFDASYGAWRDHFTAMVNGVFGSRLFLRAFEPRRRPHTDDMMQMLADIGVEPPADFTGPSFDGLTFRFR